MNKLAIILALSLVSPLALADRKDHSQIDECLVSHSHACKDIADKIKDKPEHPGKPHKPDCPKVVPIPDSVALFASALLGLVVVSRRQNPSTVIIRRK